MSAGVTHKFNYHYIFGFLFNFNQTRIFVILSRSHGFVHTNFYKVTYKLYGKKICTLHQDFLLRTHNSYCSPLFPDKT